MELSGCMGICRETILSIQDYPDDYEIITPSISILAQPSVAVVDSVVDARGTREVATEYLQYLYSDEAQRIAGDNYYRPSNSSSDHCCDRIFAEGLAILLGGNF